MALFTLPGNEKQQAPSHIILATREVVSELVAAMLPYLDDSDATPTRFMRQIVRDDMDKILPEIIQIIAFKKDAELSLQYESMQMVQDAMGERDVTQVVEYTRFLVNLGMHLVGVLQRIGAYHNNRLMYSYKCMQNENIVLEHVLFTGDGRDPQVSP
jgi:hypothetical protein